MSLEVHKVLNSTNFNTFVANNNGSFLQSSSWGQWQETNGRKSFRYEVRENDSISDEPVLAVQLIKYPLPFGQYYLYCPYGPVVGIKFKNQSEKLAETMRVLLKQLKVEFPDCLFVKLEPTIPEFGIGSAGWRTEFGTQTATRIQPASTLLLDLSKSREQLLKEMHPKNRYNIHVAEKYGVAIKSGDNLSAPEVEGILELIHSTTNRQAYRGHPLSYYQNFCKFFNTPDPENSKTRFQVSWSAAFYEGTMLAGAIFVDFGDTRDFLFGGSSDAHREVMASFLMQWNSIQDAKIKGLTVYDFGGTETSSGELPGFVRFKLRFGGEQVSYPQAQDLTWQRTKYQLYRLTKKILR